jgi:class 3 adenylate cyclase
LAVQLVALHNSVEAAWRPAVNVAARVEQLTKTTGDAILLTQSCVDALASRPVGLVDRGPHTLKGKSAAVQVFTLEERSWSAP